MENLDHKYFSYFCQTLDKIRSLKGTDKNYLLEEYINKFKQDDTFNIKQILRLILPHLDKERKTFGMKEHTLAKIITSYYKILEGSNDYKQIHLKMYPEIKRVGDFGFIVSQAIQKFITKKESNLTIDQLNNFLTQISTDSKHDAFNELLSIVSANEIKWIIRIILKEVKIGLHDDVVLSIYEPKAGELSKYIIGLQDILKNVSDKTTSKISNFDSSSDIIFQFLRPMLSVKATPKLLGEIELKGRYVEQKYDGERFQFHFKSNGEYKWFTRQGNEVRNAIYDNLSHAIKIHISKNVFSTVLDGELVGFNKNTRIYGTKGYNYDIKKVNQDSKFQPCFIVFDVLYYNGINVMREPLHKRKNILNKILPSNIPGMFINSTHLTVNDFNDVVHNLNVSMAKDWEGIVLKDPYSLYLSNERTDDWIKLKGEYFENLLTELDLLIIGGYYGERKQSGNITTFLMGVCCDSNETKQFLSISKSGLGLTNKELNKLQSYLDRHWIKKKSGCPLTIQCDKEKPDVWIQPENSVILEIKASELHRSSGFKSSHTLRFPRIMKVRYDKPWFDCMTLTELHKIILEPTNPVIKLFKRFVTVDDLKVKEDQTKHDLWTIKPKIENEAKDVRVETNFLNSKEFMVITGNDEYSKEDIEKMIVENGGKVTNMYSSNTYCCIVGIRNFKADTEIKLGQKNIVKFDWLLNEISKVNTSENFEHWLPHDALSSSLPKKKMFNVKYDKFGDSFIEKSDINALNQCLLSMDVDIVL